MIKLLEISPVLTVFPYALLYYALLLASSGLAFAACLRSGSCNRSLRTSLLVIFISQLFLLTSNLLSYQGLDAVDAIFPILHRSFNLVSLLWLVWAIFQAREEHTPTWIPSIATVVVLIAAAFSALWWLPVANQRSFNFTAVDYGWIVITFLLVFVSGIAYLLRFKSKAAEPLLILAVASIGFILYLVLPEAGSLPAIVMLSQLLYYPILISLASQDAKAREAAGQVYDDPTTNSSLRGNIAKTFLDISLQSNRNSLERSLSHGLSLYLMADLLGFLSLEDGAENIKLTNTYDLIREDHLGKVGLPVEQFPSLVASMQNKTSLLSNKASDLRSEKEALIPLSGYNRIGNLMLFPLTSHKPNVRRAILALSPYTGKQWGQEELNRLGQLEETISKLLEKAVKLEEDASHLNELQEELVEKTQQIRILNLNYDKSQTDLAQASDDLAQTQAVWTEEVTLWIERQKELEAELEELQTTIELNRENVAQVDQLRLQKEQLETTISQNAQQAEQLKGALDQASQLLNKLTFPSEPTTRSLDLEDNEWVQEDIVDNESDF